MTRRILLLFIFLPLFQIASAEFCKNITDESFSLNEVLEKGTLKGSCKKYFNSNEKTFCEKIKCGKELFFYGDFNAKGLPSALYNFVEKNFEDLVGKQYSKFGMIPDPYSTFPVGVVKGSKLGAVSTNIFTCASCHFGKTPNGIYSVGMPNNSYEYGKQMLILNVLPSVATKFGKEDPLKDIPVKSAELLKPYLSKFQQKPQLKVELISKLLPLLFTGRKPPVITNQMKLAYSSWKPGTMDFLMSPLPFDDGVHTISRVTSIWDIPNDSETAKYGMPHQLLGNTGATQSLEYFVEWFIRFMDGDLKYWNSERREPLVAYMAFLKSPKLRNLNQFKINEGENIFRSEGCLSCHNGVAHSGTKVFEVEEIGVDKAIKKWADPELSGKPCCGLNFSGKDIATNGVKVPRLSGVWAQTRLLHNGSVETLEELLCVNRRNKNLDLFSPYSSVGHNYGCESLSLEEKTNLIEFLKSL
jgi:hypothetical protein